MWSGPGAVPGGNPMLQQGVDAASAPFPTLSLLKHPPVLGHETESEPVCLPAITHSYQRRFPTHVYIPPQS